MGMDSDKLDQTVLALLHLGLHEGNRTWKGFDWDAMNRLKRAAEARYRDSAVETSSGTPG